MNYIHWTNDDGDDDRRWHIYNQIRLSKVKQVMRERFFVISQVKDLIEFRDQYIGRKRLRQREDTQSRETWKGLEEQVFF